MIKVKVEEEFFHDYVGIYIKEGRPGRQSQRLHLDEDGALRWVDIAPGLPAEVTLRLPDEIARPLLDALHRHYAGTTDARDLRADYDHERKRVDRLINALIEPPQATYSDRQVERP